MSDWISLGSTDQYPLNQAVLVEDTELGPLVVVFQEKKYHVLEGVCSHEDFELGGSPVQEGQLTCMLHMSCFKLDTGEVLNPPAEENLKIFSSKISEGELLVKKFSD